MFRVKECKVSAENSFVYLVHSFKPNTCVDGRLKVQITDSQASLMHMFLVQPRARSFVSISVSRQYNIVVIQILSILIFDKISIEALKAHQD